MARLIDADALYEIYEKRYDFNRRLVTGGAKTITWAEAMGLLIEAPTIEAEPVKHGKWHWDENDDLICSVCDKKWDENFYMECIYSEWTQFPPYCPNCGARMDGE